MWQSISVLICTVLASVSICGNLLVPLFVLCLHLLVLLLIKILHWGFQAPQVTNAGLILFLFVCFV